jgi:P pilus assembly chaperone PapD
MFFSPSIKRRIGSLPGQMFLSSRGASPGKVYFLIGLFLLLLLPQQEALADLMLHPTRVLFEKNQRAAQVELVNNGTEPASYRIRLVNRRMSETGQFSAVDSPAPGEQFAHDFLRYSPRQITLAPGETQIVRIMLRKPANLTPGEYRSHLQFDKLPDPKGASSIETLKKSDRGIGVVLDVLVGVSIPVIVRHGDTTANVSLTMLELKKPAGEPPILALQLNLSGNRSVYGDLAVSFTPRGGVEQSLAKIGGVAVYTPNPLRRAQIQLQPPAGLELAHGTLRVTYQEPLDKGGKLLAETELALP